MGLPIDDTQTICSLSAAQEFVNLNQDLTRVCVAITGVHVQDIFEMSKLVSTKEGESGCRI
jgi:hypothetical protein